MENKIKLIHVAPKMGAMTAAKKRMTVMIK
jgi:hypothetical protein